MAKMPWESILNPRASNKYDIEIKELFKSGEKVKDIAAELGLEPGFVRDVLRRLKLKGSPR